MNGKNPRGRQGNLNFQLTVSQQRGCLSATSLATVVRECGYGEILQTAYCLVLPGTKLVRTVWLFVFFVFVFLLFGGDF